MIRKIKYYIGSRILNILRVIYNLSHPLKNVFNFKRKQEIVVQCMILLVPLASRLAIYRPDKSTKNMLSSLLRISLAKEYASIFMRSKEYDLIQSMISEVEPPWGWQSKVGKFELKYRIKKALKLSGLK